MADTLPTAPVGMGGAPTNELGDPIGQPQPSQGPVNELGAALPQAQQQPQLQAPDPAAAQAAHDQMFGKIAKQILGMSNSYSTDANGNLQNNPVPQKPGQLFRALLGSALIGGAAGASHPEQGIVGGLVRGGAAGVQQAQQNDIQQRQQAEQDFANNQKTQEQNRQEMLTNATVAHMHAETVARQHTSDLQDAAAHLAHSNASAALVTNLTNAGGVPAIIPVGQGQPSSEFSANDLAQAYIRDPSILKAPQGFVRHFVDQSDSSDLTYNGTNWVTSDGTPANLTNHTTVKAIDVPINAMTTKIPTTGKDINAAYGGKLVNPDTTYQMSPLDMDALNTKRMSTAKAKLGDELEQKRVALAGMQIALDGKRVNAAITADNRASFAGADKEISERIKTLEDQIKDPMIDPAVKQTAQAHIDQANKELETIRKKLYPGTNVDEDLDTAQQTLATQTPTVLMLNPQGQQVAVPQDKVDGALKNGYKHTGAAATPTDPSIGLNQRNANRRKAIGEAAGDVLHAIPNIL